MSPPAHDVVVCGAGIAGVSLAYDLAVRRGVTRVAVVDERAPMTLTSSRGTQAYRNWWTGADGVMLRLVGRSLDLLEELDEASSGAFRMNRRGYVFLSADRAQVPRWRERAARVSSLGGGPLREHPGASSYPEAPAEGAPPGLDGFDLVDDARAIHRRFPFVTPDAAAMLHVRRAGWLDAPALGAWLLGRAEARGVERVRARVTGFEAEAGRVRAVRLADGGRLPCGAAVVAAGPHSGEMARLLGVELPLFNELHGKLALPDPLGVVPWDAPLMIWTDPTPLVWGEAERRELVAREETRALLEPFPGGVHLRIRPDPEGQRILVIWTYERKPTAPVEPPVFPERFGEILLRGLTRMVPGLSAYHGRASDGVVDGGYYCRTRENRPLIGPLPPGGAYVLAGLSGYGVMSSQACAELAAAHVTGAALPPDAASFRLERYADPSYRARLAELEADDGQL